MGPLFFQKDIIAGDLYEFSISCSFDMRIINMVE